MSSIGIITIHKINNYGSVLQAYALQRICELMGYVVEIIDYEFPNEFHRKNLYTNNHKAQSTEPRWIKLIFALDLIRQHKGISKFVGKYQKLSTRTFHSPEQLALTPPHYNIYITGSDQLWSPRHCNGDPAFMLHFAPFNAKKISYAASLGSISIPEHLQNSYKNLLSRYNYISVREASNAELIENLTGRNCSVVLDPTLLLNYKEWNSMASQQRLIKQPYVLCYFLNYSFNSFPYVDDFAEYIREVTGYKLVYVSRPPHKLKFHNRIYKIGATPEEFLALIRDAEMVLTTSFHGTAFAINYGRPVFSVVENRNAVDTRQIDLLKKLHLEDSIVSVNDSFPSPAIAKYDVETEQHNLECLRTESLNFLRTALSQAE